jgi:PAP_fibrillin
MQLLLPRRLSLLGLILIRASCGFQTPHATMFGSSVLRQGPLKVSETRHNRCPASTRVASTYSDDGGAPSDYDSDDLLQAKQVTVDSKSEDATIRDALKRELLLLSSVTNRGEYATLDEQNILIDLVSQLEALNPTENPAANAVGGWDLCLSSTQFFRSSPFFQSIRIAAGDENKQMVENGFDLHDRATSASRVGRVRQTVSSTTLRSELDLEVGLVPGIPIKMRGTVVTLASLKVLPPETWEVRITTTSVKSSNIPFLNEMLDDPKLELPVGDFYNSVLGKTPTVPFRTFYVDEAVRITRDVDDNFFVFTRA